MERLRSQAEVWEPAADAFLAELGISPGSRVLDLGCGAMGVLKPLSRLVGDGLERGPLVRRMRLLLGLAVRSKTTRRVERGPIPCCDHIISIETHSDT